MQESILAKLKSQKQSPLPQLKSSSSFYKPYSKLYDTHKHSNHQQNDSKISEMSQKKMIIKYKGRKVDPFEDDGQNQYTSSYKREYGIHQSSQQTDSNAPYSYRENRTNKKNIQNFKSIGSLSDLCKLGSNDKKKKGQKQEYFNQNNDMKHNNEENDYNLQKQSECISSDQQPLNLIKSECFSVNDPFDPNIFDTLSIKDLQQYVPEEILMNKDINIDKLIEDNTDYFYHLAKQCACYKCACGACKCEGTQLKIKYSSGFKSSYSRDFQSKNLFMQTPILTENKFNQLKPKEQIGNYKTAKDDLNNILPPFHRVNGPIANYGNRPMQKVTTYDNNFINWKEYQYSSYKSRQQKSTGLSHPLSYDTTYNQFHQVLPKNTQWVNEQKGKDGGVLPKNGLFFGKDQKQNMEESQQNFKNSHGFAPFNMLKEKIPSYEGQFKSTTKNDFKSLNPDNCQTKIIKGIFRQRLMDKLEDLRKNKVYKEIQDFQ